MKMLLSMRFHRLIWVSKERREYLFVWIMGRNRCGAMLAWFLSPRGHLMLPCFKWKRFQLNCAIGPEFVCPTAGSSVYVVGHGLLGPRSGLCSSLSSGVVSKIVKIPSAQHSHLSSTMEADNMDMPVMLQTTAAVHPGACGGVLVNSHGRMVGIITSNAKHGGGSTIPHLNFSIPCKSLEMILKYSANGDFAMLEHLDKPNEVLSSVWALAPASLPIFSSSPEKDREGKVLELSKFLADKQEGLKSGRDIEVFLRHKIPGKI